MKKFLMTFAAVLCCAMTTTLFTACGGDDDDDNKNPAEDLTPKAAVMDCEITVGDDMLNTFNLTIEYYDANGKVQSEKLTQKSWSKKVKASLPAKVGARLLLQIKDGVDVASAETFTAVYGYSYQAYAVTASDKVVSNIAAGGINTTLPMKGEKVADWVRKHYDGLVQVLYNFSSTGMGLSASWE